MFFFREFFKKFFLFLPRDKRRWIKVGGDKSELLFFSFFSGGGGDSSSFVSFLKGRRSAPSIHLKNFYFSTLPLFDRLNQSDKPLLRTKPHTHCEILFKKWPTGCCFEKNLNSNK
jgi:hypothetical protein